MRRPYLVGAGIVAILAVLISTTFAGAATTRTFPTAPTFTRRTTNTSIRIAALQETGKRAIANRMQFLNTLTSRINDASYLTTENKAGLLDRIDATKTGLSELEGTIAADTDTTTLKADLRKIIDNYRVYLVVGPVTRIVITADRLTATAELFERYAKKVSNDVGDFELNGKDVTDADACLQTMNDNIASAKSQIDGVTADVLSVVPAGYPGNRKTLESARMNIRSARGSLVKALEAARTCKGLILDYRAESTDSGVEATTTSAY